MSQKMRQTKYSDTEMQQQEKRLDIKKIYIKDLSFEAPKLPGENDDKWQSHLDIQLHNSSNKTAKKNIYEVVLQITITATEKDKTMFMLEVAQAGMFELIGIEKGEIPMALQVHCPNILFPFARETIASLIAKGGFPQLLIGPINFDAIYNQKLQSLQSESQQHGKPH